MRQISPERRLPDDRIPARDQNERRAHHRHRFAVDQDKRSIFPATDEITALEPDEK
jgi:hypothetical protein